MRHRWALWNVVQKIECHCRVTRVKWRKKWMRRYRDHKTVFPFYDVIRSMKYAHMCVRELHWRAHRKGHHFCPLTSHFQKVWTDSQVGGEQRGVYSHWFLCITFWHYFTPGFKDTRERLGILQGLKKNDCQPGWGSAGSVSRPPGAVAQCKAGFHSLRPAGGFFWGGWQWLQRAQKETTERNRLKSNSCSQWAHWSGKPNTSNTWQKPFWKKKLHLSTKKATGIHFYTPVLGGICLQLQPPTSNDFKT